MLTLERCEYSDIVFLNLCFHYDSGSYQTCVDLLTSEEAALLNVFPSFFLSVLQIKMRLDAGEINFLTGDGINALINEWVQDSNVDTYSEVVCFVLAEYTYKTFNVYKKNSAYNAVMSFVTSQHFDSQAGEYIQEWDDEESRERKSVMLDVVFEKASSALVSRLKELKRTVSQ